MRLLQFQIGVANQRARFAQPKAKLSNHPLALAHTQMNAVALPDPNPEGLPVPQGPRQPNLALRAVQHCLHLLELRFAQALGPSGSRPFHQPGQTPFFKMSNPILHRPWGIPQESTHLRAAHPLSHQQHPVKTVIVARFLRTTNLISKSKNHGSRIGDGKWFHAPMKPHLQQMRNCL